MLQWVHQCSWRKELRRQHGGGKDVRTMRCACPRKWPAQAQTRFSAEQAFMKGGSSNQCWAFTAYFRIDTIFCGALGRVFHNLKSLETPISVQLIRGTLSLLASWPPVLIWSMPTFLPAHFHGNLISTSGKLGFSLVLLSCTGLVAAS